jgi:hypothetical protein
VRCRSPLQEEIIDANPLKRAKDTARLGGATQDFGRSVANFLSGREPRAMRKLAIPPANRSAARPRCARRIPSRLRNISARISAAFRFNAWAAILSFAISFGVPTIP